MNASHETANLPTPVSTATPSASAPVPRVQHTHVVRAPIAATWAAIAEMHTVADWHPNVARVSVLTPNHSGVGAARRVEFHDGNSVVETVTDAQEHRCLVMRMTESPLLDNAVVTFRTERRSAEATEVTLAIAYDVKLGPIGWLIDRLMLRRVFRKVFAAALQGLGDYLEEVGSSSLTT